MRTLYQQLINDNVLCEDKAQLEAIKALSNLSAQLLAKQNKQPAKALLKKTFTNTANSHIQGLYFYGRVGRGKTMLMDLFYKNLTIKNKKRIHFHRFMEEIHQTLNKLTLLQPPINDPLDHIAKSWADRLDLLCFDEFFVSDIGDAMILAGLFKALFAQGLTLVATSNCQPEQLYRNGLQRERFLPTIALINRYCQVISIDGNIDHRLSEIDVGQYSNYYFTHLQGEVRLAKRFEQLYEDDIATADLSINGSICVNGREMNFIKKVSNERYVKKYHIKRNEQYIWFDFFALCSGPRSQRDYMFLADKFTTVFISRVPRFSGQLISAVFSGVEDSYQRSGVLMGDLQHLDDEARRFIALVDEFYDRNVKLVVSADVDIAELYQGKQLRFEFQRCQSRLFEMQKEGER